MTPPQLAIGKLYQIYLILWAAMLAAVVLYYVVTRLVPATDADPNSPLVLPLLGLAIATALASVYVKSRLGARLGQTRSIALVRSAYILAFALSEVPAILGLVAYFVAAWPRYWIFSLVSGAAFIVNFPQRADFEVDRGK